MANRHSKIKRNGKGFGIPIHSSISSQSRVSINAQTHRVIPSSDLENFRQELKRLSSDQILELEAIFINDGEDEFYRKLYQHEIRVSARATAQSPGLYWFEVLMQAQRLKGGAA